MKNDVIKEIKRNYLQLEKALIAELFMTVNAHHLTAGTFREKIWKGFFENIIPKKFTIEQGAFLIDSKGKVSGETDLVIFDEQYTPYVLRNRNIKFIPIEAVVAVIQCKSTAFPSNDLIAWENSIDLLKTSSDGYAGSVLGEINFNKRTVRPLKIICGLFDRKERAIATFLDKKSQSDLLIVAHSEKDGNGVYRSTDDKITIYSKHQNVRAVFRQIDPKAIIKIPKMDNETPSQKQNREDKQAQIDSVLDFKKEDFSIYSFHQKGNRGQEISLLTLVFQINQYLMLINNPMFFPHRAYINMFNQPDHNLD